MKCEIQERGNYQHFRVFIQNTLAVQLAMTAKKHKQLFLSKI